jgi:hypothetical protein
MGITHWVEKLPSPPPPFIGTISSNAMFAITILESCKCNIGSQFLCNLTNNPTWVQIGLEFWFSGDMGVFTCIFINLFIIGARKTSIVFFSFEGKH